MNQTIGPFYAIVRYASAVGKPRLFGAGTFQPVVLHAAQVKILKRLVRFFQILSGRNADSETSEMSAVPRSVLGGVGGLRSGSSGCRPLA